MRAANLVKALGVCSAVVGAAGCATTAVMEQELAKTNTQTVLAFEETVYNKHEVTEAFQHYVGMAYRQHDPEIPGGKDAAIRALSDLLANVYPNSHLTVRRTVAQGDLVAIQALWDRRPGRIPGVDKVDIYRLQDGRIVEHWGVAQPAVEQSSD